MTSIADNLKKETCVNYQFSESHDGAESQEATGERSRASLNNEQLALLTNKLALTIKEAAQVLQIGLSACYEQVRAGDIPSLKLGGQYRIPTARLASMLGIDISVSGKTCISASSADADALERERRKEQLLIEQAKIEAELKVLDQQSGVTYQLNKKTDRQNANLKKSPRY